MKKGILLTGLIACMSQLQAADNFETLKVNNSSTYSYEVKYTLGGEQATLELPAGGHIEVPIADEPVQQLSFTRQGGVLPASDRSVDMSELKQAFAKNKHLVVNIQAGYTQSYYEIKPDPTYVLKGALGALFGK